MAVDIAELRFVVDSRQAKTASGDLDKLTKKAKPTAKGIKELGTSSKVAGRAMSSFKTQIISVIGGMVALVAVMATVRKALTLSLGFDEALSEASTLIEGTVEELIELEDAARRMGIAFGTDSTEQVKGFYQAISAGATTVTAATELLEIANKLALGGVTDLVTSVDVLTTAVNSYSKTGLTAANASDILFIGIKAGKTTATELGASLGRVTSIAAQVGFSFDELVASVAALTAGGIETAEAVTGMRSIIAGLLSPTTQATELAEKLGIEFSTTALKTKGLSEFMKDLVERTGGSQEAIATLFGNVRAMGAVLAFTGAAGDKFNSTMKQMEDSLGATDEAAEKMAAGFKNRLAVQIQIFNDIMLSVGQTVQTILVPALELLTSSFDILTSVIIILVATQLPRLVVMLHAIAAGLLTVSTATTAWTVTVTFLRRGLVLLGGPIALLAGAAALLILNFDTVKVTLRGLLGITDSVAEATNKLVMAAGDEITQIGLLNKALHSSSVLSVEAAEVKLKEANTRLLNIQAIQVEQRLLALGSTEAIRLRDQLLSQEIQLAAAKKQRDAGDPTLGITIRETEGTLSVGQDILDRLVAPNQLLENAVLKAEENVRILTDALAAQKNGMVALGGAIIPIEVATRALTQATEEQIAAAKKAEDARLEAIKQATSIVDGLREEVMMLGLTNDQQELYNALKAAGAGATAIQREEIAELLIILREFSEEEERQRVITEGLTTAFGGFFDSIVNGSRTAKEALVDLGLQLAQIILKLIFANQLAAAGGGSGGGGLGGLLGKLAIIAIGAAFSGGTGFVPPQGAPLSAGPFAHGGGFTVGGRGGQDANIVSFKATRGENVTVTPPGQQSGGNTYFIDARGADPAAIMRLEQALVEIAGPGKIERRAVSAVVNARRRNPNIFGIS